MIDSFDLYEKLVADVNALQGGHIRPNRNFINWVNEVSLELFQELYEEFEKSQNISDKLTPYLRTRNIVITPLRGSMNDLIKKPSDYGRFAMIRAYKRGADFAGKPGISTYDCNGNEATCPILLDEDELAALQQNQDSKLKEIEVEKIDNGRWGALARRVSKAASINSPKCTQFDQGFKIMPKQLGIVVFDYFTLPTDATFEYTIANQGTENETIQYDAINSKKLEWDRTMIPEFLTRLKIKYGISNNKMGMVAHGEQTKK